MKTVLLLVLLVVSGTIYAQLPKDFTPLFNEKDLSGWTRKGTSIPDSVWQWQDGVLRTTQGNTGGTGWIQYDKKQYTDFEFYCEWKCGHNGNSGFQFDIAEDSEHPVWDAIEVQMCEDSTFSWWWEKNGYFKNDPRQISGGVYPFVGASKNVYKGMDKWNSTLVKSIGDKIIVIMNGKKVVNINRNDYTEKVFLWKERMSLSERPKTGFIGLQSHKGGVTYFRNIGIKEL